MYNRVGNPAYSLCIVLIVSAAALAQTPSPSPTPPVTDIFLIDFANKDDKITFGKPLKITEWEGYNNQPSFLPDGQGLFYTSIRADKQADIYRYEIRIGKTSRVTETPESEYSPTVTPDGKFISVVRVEADSTQRLWKFPLNGGTPSLILQRIKPVGYHLWIDDHTLALFILGKPNTLQIIDVHKISDQEWIIKAFDLETRTITPLIKTLAGVEDYAWTPSGVLLMAKDSKLFAWNPAADKDWREIADFSQAGLKGITRIAVSPKENRIALVARH